jgi:hypothetical protein
MCLNLLIEPKLSISVISSELAYGFLKISKID